MMNKVGKITSSAEEDGLKVGKITSSAEEDGLSGYNLHNVTKMKNSDSPKTSIWTVPFLGLSLCQPIVYEFSRGGFLVASLGPPCCDEGVVVDAAAGGLVWE